MVFVMMWSSYIWATSLGSLSNYGSSVALVFIDLVFVAIVFVAVVLVQGVLASPWIRSCVEGVD